MNTSPKLAHSVQIMKTTPAPKKKFRLNWPNIICQILAAGAFSMLLITLLEGLIE